MMYDFIVGISVFLCVFVFIPLMVILYPFVMYGRLKAIYVVYDTGNEKGYFTNHFSAERFMEKNKTCECCWYITQYPVNQAAGQGVDAG